MKHCFRLLALAATFLQAIGLQTVRADQVTLAAWDFSNNINNYEPSYVYNR